MLALQSFTLKTVVKSQLNYKKHLNKDSLKPSLVAGVYYLAILAFSISCTSIKIPVTKKNHHLYNGRYEPLSKNDFSDHLASLRVPFLAGSGVKVSDVPEARKYLKQLTNEIISKNEIFFKNLNSASVTILESNSPIHFSLPKGEIFISTGLISKYIKHESMLVSVLSYELVRSENLLYPKNIIIPVGHISIGRMLRFSKLDLEEKIEIHKWAHYLTIRSGYDGEYYLAWLQTQNRNTADFLLQVGDIDTINSEESLFKAFLIKSSVEDDLTLKKNSSKKFYTFINSIRDRIL